MFNIQYLKIKFKLVEIKNSLKLSSKRRNEKLTDVFKILRSVFRLISFRELKLVNFTQKIDN